MNQDIVSKVPIPDDVKVEFNGKEIIVSSKGKESRRKVSSLCKIEVSDKEVVLTSKEASKREKALIGTYVAQLNNMFFGVLKGFTYELKVCSSHFPMTVTFSNNQFTIKNYLGEKNPRVLDLKKYGADVKLKVKGDLIEVESHDLEKAGIVATKLEAMTRETKKDIRIFQDGIYIIKKPKRDKL